MIVDKYFRPEVLTFLLDSYSGTREEIADAVSIPLTDLLAYEDGTKIPSRDVVKAIATALKIAEHDLIEFETIGGLRYDDC